jgi:hypothetical protein
MKNTSIFTLLFLISFTCFSQEIVPLEEKYEFVHTGDMSVPYYLKDVNHLLDKFIGEWEYSDSDHYLKIKLYKIEGINKSSRPKVTYDEIRSFILYKEKVGSTWTTIYNTYPTTYTIADLNNQNFNDGYGINGNSIDTRNIDKLYLNYYEPLPPCTVMIITTFHLTYTNIGGIPQLQWEVGNKYHAYGNTEPCSSSTINPPQDFRIPKNIILNKL